MAFLNLLLLLLIFLIFGSIQCPTTYEDQCPILEWAMEEELPELEFSLDWSVLGPFQIGTREAPWGADPLESRGGFASLSYEANATFKSSLAADAIVRWTRIQAAKLESSGPSPSPSSKVQLKLEFPSVNWDLLQTAYGWPSLQYQAWARGHLRSRAPQLLIVHFHCLGVLEVIIDGRRHFGGDFYSFRRAPLVLRIYPGEHVLHTIDVRLIRDVRAMGGNDRGIEVQLEVQALKTGVELVESSLLISDVVNGKFASELASIVLRNNGEEPAVITSSELNGKGPIETQPLEPDRPFIIAPGQTRPYNFRVSLVHDDIPTAVGSVVLSFSHPEATKQEPPPILYFNLPFNQRRLSEPHKVTHLHPSGIVSYSILRPPSPNAVGNSSTSKLPILLQLHGAGVEASWDIVFQSLNSIPDLRTWVLFPSGVTPWSADDWHAWGFADVQAAIDNIPSWIERHEFELVGIDTSSWIVSGHSNGGQGAWYALTHHPDLALGAAPVSGYLSIQQYVPYTYWHPIDSKKRAVVESATNSYHLALLTSNAKGIDIEQQHGSQDDNVPPYQSRLMAQLLAETNGSSHFVELSTPGEQSGHWYDGIMTTENLRHFYERMCENYQQRGALVLRSGKTDPADDIFFTLVVGNPADQGPKGGFKVTQLRDPGQLGKLHVHFSSKTKAWDLRSANILCFEIPLAAELPHEFDSLNLSEVIIDGQKLNFIESEPRNMTVWRDLQEWKIKAQAPPNFVRRGKQLGGMEAILRTNGPFQIVYYDDNAFDVALQISRNLYQYFFADSEIINGSQSLSLKETKGNVITVAVGADLPQSLVNIDFPVSITTTLREDTKLSVRNRNGVVHEIIPHHGHLGATFLRPLQDERLELVVWGQNLDQLWWSSCLVPTLTGVGQPDFIIFDHELRWKGADAAAIGFFDAWWNVSEGSVLDLG